MSDDELTDDPCRAESTVSLPRAIAFVLMFVSMAGFAVFAMVVDSFASCCLVSVFGYTAAVMLYGFARNKGGNQPFLFTCPVVVSQYPHLLKRHSVFLVMLIAILIVAHLIKVHSSERRSQISDASYFALAIPIGALALTEVMTNRGLLERAHRDRFEEPPFSRWFGG